MKVLSKISKTIRHTATILCYFTVFDSWKKLKKCDVLLLAHNNNRSLNIEGKTYSPLIHTIRFYLEKKGINCSGISTIFDIKNFTHNYYEDKTINIVFLLNILRTKLVSIFVRSNYSEIKTKNEVLIWEKILKIASPKVVIAIQPTTALCIACHKLSIFVYDLQHGVIDEGTIYGQSYNLERDINQLPTGYLCWNQESAAVLNRWCSPRGIQVEVLGNPWLYRFQKNEESDFLIRDIQSKRPFKTNKKCILITLQWGLDKFYPEHFRAGDLLHPVILDTIICLEDNVNWLIRLHPIQMKNAKTLNEISHQLKKYPNVDIYWSSLKPLPIILPHTHGHITWDSYTVIEAAQFGIPSYILNPSYFSYIKTKSAHKSTEKELLKLPYSSLEAEGLITRSKVKPSVTDLITWVNESDLNNKHNSTQFIFDENKLYAIAGQGRQNLDL